MKTTRELHAALERLLDDPVDWVRRRPYAFRTSFAIDALEVRTHGGSLVRLLLKDLGAASDEARSVKPAFLHDPLREIDVYREILAARPLGTAHCYGSVVDPRRDRYWLFLEHVPGVELCVVGELSVWQEAARWLAELHSSCRDVTHPRLLRCDQRSYEEWLDRALAVNDDRRLQAIAAGFPAVVKRLLALPTTLIHNEFYPSNVLIERRGKCVRVCPVDWEMAARGPALIDLAALTGGKWRDAERARIIAAYVEAIEGPMHTENLVAALACCRLVLALRWLGWSRVWEPPPGHAQDWLQVAVGAAAEVGLS
jgi:hypothetical protein